MADPVLIVLPLARGERCPTLALMTSSEEELHLRVRLNDTGQAIHVLHAFVMRLCECGQNQRVTRLELPLGMPVWPMKESALGAWLIEDSLMRLPGLRALHLCVDALSDNEDESGDEVLLSTQQNDVWRNAWEPLADALYSVALDELSVSTPLRMPNGDFDDFVLAFVVRATAGPRVAPVRSSRKTGETLWIFDEAEEDTSTNKRRLVLCDYGSWSGDGVECLLDHMRIDELVLAGGDVLSPPGLTPSAHPSAITRTKLTLKVAPECVEAVKARLGGLRRAYEVVESAAV